MRTIYESDDSELHPWLTEELRLLDKVQIGMRGTPVRRVQEWLTLRGYALVVDGAFGVATAETVARFQQDSFLPATGQVDTATFGQLTAPLREVLQQRLKESSTLGDAILTYANVHLAVHPREVGGQNRGPWVRTYMQGNEGTSWPWCAGFVTFLLRQATDSLQVGMPIQGSFSCDSLAAQAKAKNLFVPGREAEGRVTPGSFFLNRRTSTDWTHVGVVADADNLTITTIEGNTNDEGSREGHEVCIRTRSYDGRDFIIFDA